MRLETVTTPPTLGAGRRFSYTWPHLSASNVGSDPNGQQNVAPRALGIPSATFYNVVVTGAPPAPRGYQLFRNRVTWAMTSNAGTGYVCKPNFAVINRPLVMPFQDTQTPGVSFEGVDDYWCWSASAILAFDAIPGLITGDIGLSVGCGTRAVIRDPAVASAGMQIGPTNTGTIGVVIRQLDGAAITLAQNLAGVADMTVFHKYEIRLVGPTLAAQAQAKFLIDGVVQLSVPFGPGTILPGQAMTAPSSIGFTPGIVNFNANAATTRMYLVPDGLTVCAAPTEDALL